MTCLGHTTHDLGPIVGRESKDFFAWTQAHVLPIVPCCPSPEIIEADGNIRKEREWSFLHLRVAQESLLALTLRSLFLPIGSLRVRANKATAQRPYLGEPCSALIIKI